MAVSGQAYRRIVAGAALLSLAACTASGPPVLPFQAMSPGSDLSFGYKDVRSDAQHYTIVYADNRERAAKANLELRAAQIAREAGYPYFIFERQGVNLVKRVENDLQRRDFQRTIRGQVVPYDYLPETRLLDITLFYFAWGQIALLNDDQAHNSAKAIRAADILDRPPPPAAR